MILVKGFVTLLVILTLQTKQHENIQSSFKHRTRSNQQKINGY